MTVPMLSIILPGIIVIAAGAVVFWMVMRKYRRDLGVMEDGKERADNTSFIINAFQDVTRQLKEKEKELERLRGLAEQRAENVENYTENILQCVTSGVMSFDGQCRLKTMNKAAGDILAFPHEGSMNRTCRELFGESEISRAVYDTLENKSPSARREASLAVSRGELWLGFNTAVLNDRQKNAIGVILSFSDLTEVKLLQEQVELRERLTALGEMSAGIAHELRNPMAVISGYLNLLSKRTGSDQQTIIQNISSEISGMNRIIGDLLSFARPASLNRAQVNIRELVQTSLSAARTAVAESANVSEELDLTDGSALLDEVTMRQALTNLFQNAFEAMPAGGRLSVVVRRNGTLVIAVRDTGGGIPKDKLGKIFLPFFTLKDKGVGMGLALTHKIITAHGGRIEAESTEGVGTVFTITFPQR